MTERVDHNCFKDRDKLKELRVAHRELDTQIIELTDDPATDQLHLRRLKQRKLHLKDNITRLESALIPDLNA